VSLGPDPVFSVQERRRPPKQIAIAMRDPGAWDRLRAESKDALNLRDLDLGACNLDSRDLTNVDFTNTSLLGSTFRGAQLRGANLTDANLEGADLTGAVFSGAFMVRTNLRRANLTDADFRYAGVDWGRMQDATRRSVHWGTGLLGIAAFGVEWYYENAFASSTLLIDVDLSEATLHGTKLIGANLTGTNFAGANLQRTDLSKSVLENANFNGAKLDAVDLQSARLVSANLCGAEFRRCLVYGVSCWDVTTDDNTVQEDMIVSQIPLLTVPSLEVAQFVYLLLNNAKLRDAIDAMSTKIVLILGRFTPERKAVIDGLRDSLRKQNLVPVVYDFQGPTSRNTHETVTLIARLAKCVVADITDPKSVPQELVSIVQTLPSVPVQPLLADGAEPWGMYDHIEQYPWVLPLARYRKKEDLDVAFVTTLLAACERISVRTRKIAR
jgi:uncharacterized protein YjbI with pentapeptide repeats